MDFKDILYSIEDGVAIIRLNRPQALNAMTQNLMAELNQAFDRAAANSNVKVIVLTGEGRGFCSGADLADTAQNPPLDAQGKLDLGSLLETHYNPLLIKMRSLPKPIIAAVNGMAAGAGANLALMADLVYAARSANFLQAFVNVGLIPDAGGTWMLPRLVGLQRAAGMMLLGEKISAEKAEQWGMIWQVVDDAQLMSTVKAAAHKLANGAGYAIERIKRSLELSVKNDFARQLDVERDLQRECGQSHDFKEGATAFVEKRKANFLGR